MRMASRWKVEGAWGAMLLLTSAHFSLAYNNRSTPFLNMKEYAAGHAALPYQARVLMAWILHWAAPLPATLKLVAHAHGFVRDSFEAVMLVTSLLGMIIAIWATRRSLTVLTGDASFSRWGSFLVLWMSYFLLALPYGLSYSLPYDVPSLAFFSLGLMLVIERRTWLLPFLIAVATLNRETICFVILFYVIWEWKRLQQLAPAQRLRRILPLSLLQAAVWISVKLWLRAHFHANATQSGGNGLFQTVFGTNLHFLANPAQWPLLASLFGFLWPVLIIGRKHLSPSALRTACVVIIPAWFALMMVVGIIVEVRVFSELSALVALAVGVITYHRWIVPAEREIHASTTLP